VYGVYEIKGRRGWCTVCQKQPLASNTIRHYLLSIKAVNIFHLFFLCVPFVHTKTNAISLLSHLVITDIHK
jgi:hypothetical protein